jgi:pyruvate dehydrogenase E2 component (dihydrolipoamide acetyltransferase)
MARAFALPDLGEGLHEAEIVKVLVNEGDVIAEDAPLLEVETDKAQVEIPSPVGGRVDRIHVRPGQTVHVGDVLVTFADAASLEPPSERVAPTAEAVPAGAPAAPLAGPDAGLRVASTPSTRRLARELGVDIRGVRGTGPGGRVIDADVRAAADTESRADVRVPPAGTRSQAEPQRDREPGGAVAKPLAPVGIEAPPLPDFAQWGPVERQPLSHLRRTIAERMALSARLVPHVTHLDRADITDLDALITKNLGRARERGVTLTLTSFILRSVALALAEHPTFNASLDAGAGELILKRYCHLGVAVATERGLIVPVIRDVDRKSIGDLARELAALAARARDGKATLDDLRGGTFTVTNIGALGGTGAIPIINYPEVAILGVARARHEPVVRDGQIVPRLLLPITLTFDHRVADGADGARFAAAILRRLEHPDELLLDL